MLKLGIDLSGDYGLKGINNKNKNDVISIYSYHLVQDRVRPT